MAAGIKAKQHNTGVGLCFKPFQTPNSRFNCDHHDKPGKEKIPKRSLMWGCRECDHDVCETCYRGVLIANRTQLEKCRIVRPGDVRGDEKADRDIALQVASGYKYTKPKAPEPPKKKKKKKAKHSTKDGRCFTALRTHDAKFNCDLHDPTGKARIPKGTLMAGCRDCDYDVCMHCWKQLNPVQYERDMSEWGERKRPGHDCEAGACIKAFKTMDGHFNCDKHDPEGVESPYPEGTVMWGCRDCDYDWCANCFAEFDPIQHSKDARKFGLDVPLVEHNAEKGGHSCLLALRTTDDKFNCDHHDKRHKEKIPIGTLMWGCRECDMDWCKACFKDVNLPQYEKDIAREVDGIREMDRITNGHGGPEWKCIAPFRTVVKSTNCDKHDLHGKQKIPIGTLMWGCKICDWDCCALCYSQINPDQFEEDIEQFGGAENILGPSGKKMLGLDADVGETEGV